MRWAALGRRDGTFYVVGLSGATWLICSEREKWAENRRTVYADMKNPRPATTRLSAYAPYDEIAVAIARPKFDPTRMIYR